MEARRLIAAFLMVSLVGCTKVPQNRPSMSNIERSSTKLLSECLNSIKTRLCELQGKYPQLSGIRSATVTPSTLSYTKGKVSWPEGGACVPEFSGLVGCQLDIKLIQAPPHSRLFPPAHAGCAGITSCYFPQVGLRVDLLFVCTEPDAADLQQIVQSIVKEESIWLTVRLDMAKNMKPIQAP